MSWLRNLWRSLRIEVEGNEERTERLYHVTSETDAWAIIDCQQMLGSFFGAYGGGIYFEETEEEAKRKARFHGGIVEADVKLGYSLLRWRSMPDVNSRTLDMKYRCSSVKAMNISPPQYVVYRRSQVTIRRVYIEGKLEYDSSRPNRSHQSSERDLRILKIDPRGPHPRMSEEEYPDQHDPSRYIMLPVGPEMPQEYQDALSQFLFSPKFQSPRATEQQFQQGPLSPKYARPGAQYAAPPSNMNGASPRDPRDPSQRKALPSNADYQRAANTRSRAGNPNSSFSHTSSSGLSRAGSRVVFSRISEEDEEDILLEQ